MCCQTLFKFQVEVRHTNWFVQKHHHTPTCACIRSLASSLTLKVLGCIKSAALVAAAVIFLGEHVEVLQVVGFTISLTGFGVYTCIKGAQVAAGRGAVAGPDGNSSSSQDTASDKSASVLLGVPNSEGKSGS